MEFRANVGQLLKVLFPAINIATKNFDSDFIWSESLCITAKPDELSIKANGGTAAINIIIKEDRLKGLGYTCIEEGSILVKTEGFFKVIKSFPPAKYITLEYVGNLLIKHETFGESLTIQHAMQMDFPDPIGNHSKLVKIKRKIFVDGLRSVEFAMGHSETQQYYSCLYFEASKNHVRFVAGTGARFAVKDFDGKKIVKAKEPVSILVPSSNIKNLTAILGKSREEEITIKEFSAYGNSKHKIVIKYDNTTLVLEGMENSTNYPCMDNILNYEYPYRVETEINDWRPVIMGLEATKTDEFKRRCDIHPATVTAYLDSCYFSIVCQTDAGSHRTVEFTSKTIIEDPNDEIGNELWFTCASEYLAEMVKKAGKAKKMVIEFEGISSASVNEYAKTRPVVVRYPVIINDSGVNEKFCMFFACSKI